MKQYLFFAPLFIFIFGAVGIRLSSSDQIPPVNESVVDLSGRNLTEIPVEFKEQILKAEVLILDNNNLRELPVWFKEASNLEKLSIDNNPDFDFFKFSVDFQEMKQIEELSASGCNIMMIPYQLTFLTNLKKLDLSHNLISEVPYHFSFLTSLTSCDLSHNRIHQVGYSFRDLGKLQRLDISGNENINAKDLCASLEGKILNEFKLQIKDTLPESMANVNAKTLDITSPSKAVWGSSLSKVNCNDLVLRNSQENGSLSKEMLQSLAANQNITQLTFSDYSIREIPVQIVNKSRLKKLDVSSSELKSTVGLDRMNFLGSLNIKENLLSLEQILDLKSKLNSCSIQSDEEKLKGSNIGYSVDPPVKDWMIAAEKVIVNPKSESQFVSSTGQTTLEIPANAFLDAKGKVVTTPVEIQFREFNDPLSAALSGIPMQIKNEDGTTGDFSSAGMFELNAFSNGEPVFPNPKALITANIISKKDTPYDLYYFNEGKGWEKVQPEPIVPQVITPTDEISEAAASTGKYNSGFRSMIFYDTSITKRKYVAHPKIQYTLKKKASEQTFRIQFDSPLMYTRYGDVSCRYPVNVPEDYKTVLSHGLIYNGNKLDEDYKLMDTIRKTLKNVYMEKGFYDRYKSGGKRAVKYRYSENVLLKDIALSPDPKNDDYILSFNYRGETHKIHVIPEGEGSSAAKVQQQNKKFYQNYLFAKDKYDKALAKVVEEYKTDVKRAQDSLNKLMALNNVNLEEAKEVMESSGKAMYSLQVSKFGVTNCDVVARMQKPKAVRLTFKDILGKALIFFQMIRIDKRINAITYVGPNESLIIDYAHDETALMFIMANNQIGIVNAKDLKNHRDDSSIEVKVVDTDKFTPEKVRSML